MRVLFIHADYLEYEAKKKTKFADDLPEEDVKGRMDEVLVSFISFEKIDESKEDKSSVLLVKNIDEIAKMVDASRVVLYPYAHLSSSLAKPDTGKKILELAEPQLKELGYEVLSSPFGWYKSFKISCKGHPLSELSREIVVGEESENEVSEAVKAEEKAESSWVIMDEEGSIHGLTIEGGKVTGFDFTDKGGLRQFCQYEMAKSKVAGKEPPHVDLMKRHELVDYEPGSDPGNFRFYPKGRMIKSLLERYVTAKIQETGGMEVETPIMYDFEHPTLKSYLNRFPARQYTVQTPDKKAFLRFAACFGQFLMMKDATISYKNLPVRLYELTRYSFRAEQRGELSGLRRLRAFTMPDCHSFCGDIPMALDELEDRFKLSLNMLEGIGFAIPDELEFAIRVTRDFYNENKDFLVRMVKIWGRPTLFEIWEERFFYFIFKYECNFVDSGGKASALNTDQLDVENAERYGITYTGQDGKDNYPLILHQSPSGAIERVIYALLENIHKKQLTGEKPKFPHWLSPTQVRLIPVSNDFLDDCIQLADSIQARVDIDDRDEKVGRKIRDAEREWIDFIIVYGEKEKESGKLSVRRRTGDQVTMELQELHTKLNHLQGDFPKEPLPLPKMLSKRIAFRG